MNKLPLSLVTAIGFAIANPALAASDAYLKGGIGWAHSEKQTSTIGDLADPPDRVTSDAEGSLAYQLGVGYRLTKWLDAELSLSHIDGYELSGPYENDGSPTGEVGRTEVDTTSIMVLGLVDLAAVLDASWPLKPYVGVGVGYARHDMGRFTITNFSSRIDSHTSSGFAWKAVFGATYPLGENVSLDASYAYADYGEAESSLDAYEGGGNLQLNSPLTLDIRSHELSLSLRYRI
ncbi:outer membrane beta-barrel protein [Guyparkeria hydrothermalis]|uniref:outer membrane protein n=1 Tax=Guyparkeria hydrothermalis TaxID=923 RepID=UPI0020215F0A|nr:outer membrane beta-barrel protein [Guyparkeria hydrothermalis]MCL7750732.1 outer membrane beta-barrel protein [Guyparkeria hydrothermalis]